MAGLGDVGNAIRKVAKQVGADTKTATQRVAQRQTASRARTVGDTPYKTPPGGWTDGQIPWNERLPASMARGGGDAKHPVPRMKVTPKHQRALDRMKRASTVTPKRSDAGLPPAPKWTPADARELRRRNRQLKASGRSGEITTRQKPDGSYEYVYPHGKTAMTPSDRQSYV